jgi:hypothetical protein
MTIPLIEFPLGTQGRGWSGFEIRDSLFRLNKEGVRSCTGSRPDRLDDNAHVLPNVYGVLRLARPGTFYDWRTQNQRFESISAYRSRPMLLTGRRAELVSAQDAYDRFFYVANASRTVVLSRGVWMKRFGADARLRKG